jgi:SAM-dependent methyltransferase
MGGDGFRAGMGASARSGLARLARTVGVEVRSTRHDVAPPASWTCLNVGAGRSDIAGFVSLDVDTDHYRSDARRKFVAYDMRRSELPYDDGAVDLVYCSHVIEHVEDEYVDRFLAESSRVLRPGGVVRIATPDAGFLWSVSTFENDYWSWRERYLTASGVDIDGMDARDYLLREVDTAGFREVVGGGSTNPLDVTSTDVDGELANVTRGLVWNAKRPGDHINFWTWEKLERAAAPHFSHVVRSKYGGSVSRYMRGTNFDRTHPYMSLYVDCVK